MDGSAQLRDLAVRLKAAGETGLRREMIAGLKVGAKPLTAAVQDAARRQLPHTGGLNEQVASQKITVSVRTGARTAGVRLFTRAPDTKQTDSGYVRKPVFGNRKVWRTQQIPQAAGWWSRTLAAGAPTVAPTLRAVLEHIGAEIQGRGI